MNLKMKPVHPGAILREDVLKEMQVTVVEAAKGLQINEQLLTDVFNETIPISADLAVRLESGFGINADFWLDPPAPGSVPTYRNVQTVANADFNHATVRKADLGGLNRGGDRLQ